MRKLAMNLIPLFLVACAGEPTAPDPALLRATAPADAQRVSAAANGADRFTHRVDLPVDWLLTPSEFPCLSEAIRLVGTIEEHLVFIDGPTAVHLTVHQSTNNVTAIGQTTGDTYQFSGPFTLSASGPTDQGDPVAFTFHNINHFVGPGRDSNIYFRTLVHVTRDRATNEIKVEVIKDDVLCN